MSTITSLDLPTRVENLSEYEAELPENINLQHEGQGLSHWKNQINQFCVIRLHRSADPLKRSQAWIDKTRSTMAISDYLREYELHWEALEGKPVYSDEYAREFHVAKSSLGWNPKLAVCRGWDFGLYPACIFAQLLPFSRLIVLREAVGIDIDTERFVDEVSRLSGQWFPNATYYEFVDPTGRNRAGTDGRSYTNLLTAKPLRANKIILGANAPVKRRTSVIDFLKENLRGLPCLLIDPSCDYLVKGFGGGYMYKYTKGTLNPKPDKNIYSHIHDALQYLCSKVRSTNLDVLYKGPVAVTEPRFGGRVPPPPQEINYNIKLPQPRISGGMTYGR